MPEDSGERFVLDEAGMARVVKAVRKIEGLTARPQLVRRRTPVIPGDSDGGGITVRKNTGADVGTRGRLNLIEGVGIGLTVTDDPGDDEVDVTVTNLGGEGGGQVSAYDEEQVTTDAWADVWVYSGGPAIGYLWVRNKGDIAGTNQLVRVQYTDAEGNTGTIYTSSGTVLAFPGRLYFSIDQALVAFSLTAPLTVFQLQIKSASAGQFDTLWCLGVFMG